MTRLLAKTLGLFILGIFTGSFIITPPLAVDTKTEAVTQIQSAYPYLSAVSESQIAIPDTTKVIASEATIDARFVGVLSHVKWLIRGTTIPSRHSDDSEIVRIDKQIYSFMDDVSEDLSDLRDDIGDGGLPEAFTVDDSGIVTAGTWQGTAITDLYIADILTIGSGSTFANNLITPNGLLTTGQTDEYCLTYEATGSTWEWQVCGAGGGLTTNDIDTSAELLTIVGDETGSGNLVFSTSPTFTGTVNAAAATLSSTLTLS
ncbi:MAG: hypothetical protein KBB78_02920, partial [Candidatus Pacebacteria bacterium]|nr:hypothetical protein [Candidatus Paceibacterota bacterium]